MRAWILSFSLGLFIAGFIPRLPTLAFLPLLLIPFLLSFWFKGLRLPAAILLGTGWLLTSAGLHQQNIIPHSLEQEDVWVRGVVTGLPQFNTSSSRITFLAEVYCKTFFEDECPNPLLDKSKRKLLLNDYSGSSFHPGETWLLKVRLKQPHGFANPGSFDYELWLFQERITATGYIRADSANRKLEAKSSISVNAFFSILRMNFQNRLNEVTLTVPGFISALTIGDRYLVSDRQWELLSYSGTNHLMVISGLHLSMVAWLVFRISTLSLKNLTSVCQIIPATRLAAIVSLLAAFFYAGLAGFSLPVQRALLMVASLMSGQFFSREISAGNNLCIALLLVLILDPLAPQSAGFWLSFMAVALLLLALFPQKEDEEFSIIRKVFLSVRSQGFLFAGMLPLMLLFFQQVSFFAPLINLLAIPFIGMLVVPFCLLSLSVSFFSPDLFSQLIVVPDFLLFCYVKALEWLIQYTGFLLVKVPALPIALILLLSIAIYLQFLIIRPKARLFSIVLVLPILFYRPEKPGGEEFALDVIDVGQGLSVVIATANHVLVYDTGPAYSPRFNAGSGIIQPFLRKKNYQSPELFIISHSDNDHAGGARGLLSLYPEAALISGEEVQGLHQNRSACLAGKVWVWDKVRFEFLYPDENSYSGNHASCVLKISAGQYSALLPGDIEKEAELILLKQNRDVLNADILIAPHHGSLTSSTSLFINAVSPDYVVFSNGYLNRFNHPHPTISQRYQRYTSQLYSVSDTGNMRFSISSKNGVQLVDIYRYSQQRFWFAQ